MLDNDYLGSYFFNQIIYWIDVLDLIRCHIREVDCKSKEMIY